jgi:hypothetical protein
MLQFTRLIKSDDRQLQARDGEKDKADRCYTVQRLCNLTVIKIYVGIVKSYTL